LPTLAFMAALSIAIVEVYHQVQFRQASRYAFLVTVAFGLALGIGGGVRRSFYVAESLQQNCAVRAERDGEFLFDLFKQPATIPEARRQAGIARLSALGIKSRQDAKRLQLDLTPITLAEYKSIVASRGQDESNQEEPWRLLFQSKYEYLSF
jgi:hypothetical protein